MNNGGYLAIITARSGSKRLPNKNVLNFCGQPLFIWSVRAGLECPDVVDTIVTTDSEHYQTLAIQAGATCPYLRSPELSSDAASSADVVKDVLDHYKDGAAGYNGLVLLQPTSPLRTAADISAAICLHRDSGAPAVVSVCEAECPPAWIGQLNPDLCMDDFVRPEYRGVRSQDLGAFYRLNGAIYVIGIEAFYAEHGFMPKGTLAHIMSRERSIDIDTPLDFLIARLLMEHALKKQSKN